MNRSDLFDIIKMRRSIRLYLNVPVPDEVLHRILEAARWGPSAHNRQPWRFAVVRDPMRRAGLAEAMGARLRADLAADGVDETQIDRQVTRSYQRIAGAPVVVVLFVSMVDMDQYPDAHRHHAEYIMAVQSVALAAQNMLLTAHAEEVGACWMCAPLFCPEVVRDELGLPPDWEAQGLITLGYAAEQRERDRAPIETKTRWY